MHSRILVGTDGSETAGRAVQRAADLAKATGAQVTIASAGAAARASEVVTSAVRSYDDSGPSVDTKVLAGDPATALVEEAANGYDLLVVGNEGMAGASRFLLGSVPNKANRHSPVALPIVHTT